MAKAAEKQPERVSVSTPEILPGDVVVSHGMRVLIEGPARVYHGGCDHPLASVPACRTDVREPALIDGEACRIGYAWPGKVLNVAEVIEAGIVPRGFLFDREARQQGSGPRSRGLLDDPGQQPGALDGAPLGLTCRNVHYARSA